MTCCRCNRSGRCRNCSCVKSGTPCQGCLPQRLGNCTNANGLTSNQEQEQEQPPSVEQTSAQCSEGMNNIETEIVLEEEDFYTSVIFDPSINAAVNSPNRSTVIWPLPTMEESNFIWGNIQGKEFHVIVNQAYEEVVHWWRNLFQIPSGSAGKAFVTELAHLYQAYADGSSLEGVAMKACMVAPILLLQKSSRTSKSKDHVNHLQRRLDLWHKGEVQSLISEGKCIQNRLYKGTRQTDDD